MEPTLWEVVVAYKFPSEEWLNAFEKHLNSDGQYAEIAKNWEGDVLFAIDPEDESEGFTYFHMDLWHGRCRSVTYDPNMDELPEPKYVLTATLNRYRSILSGELDPVQAMVTRRLKVKGNMAYLLRNIPVVLDFVRCASEVGIEDEGVVN